MAEFVVEPIGSHRQNLGELLDEAAVLALARSGARGSEAILQTWKTLIADGAGFVLLDGADRVGLLLYSAEYELRFSSFLSDSSARRLPQSATISVCHVLARARDSKATSESVLLQTALSRLRLIKSIETIAVQMTPLYELDLEKPLKKMGFLNCERVRMERHLTGRIPEPGGPPECEFETPSLRDSKALRSVIYQGYFSEIDGYLFPDITAVCSDTRLFREFLGSSSIERTASITAKMHGFLCGCVLALLDEDRRYGLIGVVAVVPHMRRRGIARAMLLHVMHRLRDHHHRTAALAVTLENKPAISLYSSLGFGEARPRTAISVWRRSVSRPVIALSSGTGSVRRPQA